MCPSSARSEVGRVTPPVAFHVMNRSRVGQEPDHAFRVGAFGFRVGTIDLTNSLGLRRAIVSAIPWRTSSSTPSTSILTMSGSGSEDSLISRSIEFIGTVNTS